MEGDAQGDYFRTLLDYIHLNPVRAGITAVVPDEVPDLVGFEWSSLPFYTGRPSIRASYLKTSDGFSAFNLKDTLKGRREFLNRLEERAVNEKRKSCGLAEIGGQGLQSTLRRGWCYGSVAFKERMLEFAETGIDKLVKAVVSRKNYGVEDVRDHSERAAAKILEIGLSAFGLQKEQLESLPKGQPEKAIIAREIRNRTSAPPSWIAKNLSMGSTANIRTAGNRIEKAVKVSRELKRRQKEFLSKIG